MPRPHRPSTAQGALTLDSATVWIADNLDVLRGVASETVDLIYLDPPFNSGTDYAATVGSEAEGAEFTDTWGPGDIDRRALRDIQTSSASGDQELGRFIASVADSHSPAMGSYLAFMVPRLLELRRVLKRTGTIYLHCDPHASHYLKAAMDAAFGARHFRNEIVWTYSGGGVPRKDFPRKHDILLRYSKSDEWTFNVETSGPVADCWADVPTVTGWSAEDVGYPTQKPLALLRRIIATSSNPGDMVLDPFCGSGTTCIAAEQLERQWVGIDTEERAAKVVVARIRKQLGLFAAEVAIRTTDTLSVDPPTTVATGASGS